mmetsp:Transcript_31629/g.122447  ORF Transcript_31629/g.122447 Transcript_31629/m.122447 type:complete len:112 (-) Transcript_31629:619-954(-)
MALRAMNARTLSRAIGQVRRMSTEKPSKVLVSLAGPDRVGIVKDFSSVLHKSHGNVEESRMAQLGGEFAMISLVSQSNQKPKKPCRVDQRPEPQDLPSACVEKRQSPNLPG